MGLAPSENFVVESRKSKSYRVDNRAVSEFTKHCYRHGLVLERMVEALMIYALSMDGSELGCMLMASANWREGDRDGPDGVLPDSRVGGGVGGGTRGSGEGGHVRRQEDV